MSLPAFKKFDIYEEPTSIGTRWKSWTAELENLMLALDIKDKKRQRALFLYYAGHDVHNIYKTLIPAEDPNEELAAAKARLDAYFEPKVNATYEIYHFRRMKQGESEDETVPADETIDSFVTRLRKKAARCRFADSDTEIKYQVIFGCNSSKLRREGLKKDDVTLTNLLELGRTLETVKKQATRAWKRK